MKFLRKRQRGYAIFLSILDEQHVTGRKGRSLRQRWFQALGLALAASVSTLLAGAQTIPTETTLRISTADQGGRTLATVTTAVAGADGVPARGVVNLMEGERILSEASLDAAGVAQTTVGLTGGMHQLHAIYTGDPTHLQSSSSVEEADATTSSTPNFQLSLTPISPSSFPMVLSPGNSGTAVVTITPENNATLTAPMFVTLSCAGLPNEASCTFTPETVEILSTTPSSCPAGSPAASCPPISTMLLQTQTAGTAAQLHSATPDRSPLSWALLLPGIIGLGWGIRRRCWLNRLLLVTLLGWVAMLGVTGCSPLYRYYQHGPGAPPATPAGTYTITVTAQASNGVTAITNSTSLVLTVQ
jgi:hypothetical protein